MIYGLNRMIVLINHLLAFNVKYNQMIVIILLLKKVYRWHTFGNKCWKSMLENLILWLKKQVLKHLWMFYKTWSNLHIFLIMIKLKIISHIYFLLFKTSKLIKHFSKMLLIRRLEIYIISLKKSHTKGMIIYSIS